MARLRHKAGSGTRGFEADSGITGASFGPGSISPQESGTSQNSSPAVIRRPTNGAMQEKEDLHQEPAGTTVDRVQGKTSVTTSPLTDDPDLDLELDGCLNKHIAQKLLKGFA